MGLSLQLRHAVAAASLVLAIPAAGCGAQPETPATAPVVKAVAPVRVALLTPSSGARTRSTHVTVRGTVEPADAEVLVQGKPAAVDNGVFVATAAVRRGRTRIDVIATAPEATPASEVLVVHRPRARRAAPRTEPRVVAAPVIVEVVRGGSPSAACSAGLSVGPNTSCPFAEHVRAAYFQHGPGTVAVYRPVTRRTHAMTCSGAAPVVCTGGDNASVIIS